MLSTIDEVLGSMKHNREIWVGGLCLEFKETDMETLAMSLQTAKKLGNVWVYALVARSEYGAPFSYTHDRVSFITTPELRPVTLFDKGYCISIENAKYHYLQPRIRVDKNKLKKKIYLVPKKEVIHGVIKKREKEETIFSIQREEIAVGGFSGSDVLNCEEEMNKMAQLVIKEDVFNFFYANWKQYSWRYHSPFISPHCIEFSVHEDSFTRSVGCIPLQAHNS